MTTAGQHYTHPVMRALIAEMAPDGFGTTMEAMVDYFPDFYFIDKELSPIDPAVEYVAFCSEADGVYEGVEYCLGNTENVKREVLCEIETVDATVSVDTLTEEDMTLFLVTWFNEGGSVSTYVVPKKWIEAHHLDLDGRET